MAFDGRLGRPNFSSWSRNGLGASLNDLEKAVTDATMTREFTEWCRDSLFTVELVEAAALQERALDLYLVGIFRKLDLPSCLSDWTTPSRLASELDFVESAGIAQAEARAKPIVRSVVDHTKQQQPLRIPSEHDVDGRDGLLFVVVGDGE